MERSYLFRLRHINKERVLQKRKVAAVQEIRGMRLVKAKWIRPVAGLVVILGTVLCFLQKEESLTSQRTVLGMDISHGTIVTDMDSHGGFHGDGIAFLEVVFEDDSLGNKIAINPSWCHLPVDNHVAALLYGVELGSGLSGPYVTQNGKKLFPKVENGYYFFQNRYNGGSHSRGKDITNRESLNLTVAIYDEDSRTLYYCEFDT
jgi:hypothetical protein